mmetsp:Transcript_93665/g.136806  ORF Transcript_93665/g.136806 Transcript_93665/m.136806 type:complete len:113 (+) Transcript_93665:59-397(+)
MYLDKHAELKRSFKIALSLVGAVLAFGMNQLLNMADSAWMETHVFSKLPSWALTYGGFCFDPFPAWMETRVFSKLPTWTFTYGGYFFAFYQRFIGLFRSTASPSDDGAPPST